MRKTVTLLITTVLLCLLAVVLLFFYMESRKLVITEHEINIQVGDTYELHLSDIFEKSECSWISSDYEVASVDSKGIITGQKKGSALVTCTVEQKHKKYKFLFDVTVG